MQKGGAMDVAKREKSVRQKEYIKHKDPQTFLYLDKCKFVLKLHSDLKQDAWNLKFKK